MGCNCTLRRHPSRTRPSFLLLFHSLARLDREEKDLNRDLDKQTSAYIDLAGNERARANIKIDIERIEVMLNRLDVKRQEITAKIQQGEVSEAKIKDALEFARKIRAGLVKADGNFPKQR